MEWDCCSSACEGLFGQFSRGLFYFPLVLFETNLAPRRVGCDCIEVVDVIFCTVPSRHEIAYHVTKKHFDVTYDIEKRNVCETPSIKAREEPQRERKREIAKAQGKGGKTFKKCKARKRQVVVSRIAQRSSLTAWSVDVLL